MSKKTIISLANEVARQCSSENTPVPLDLCVYLLDLKLLQLSKDISVVTRHPVLADAIVKKCINDLKENSLSVKTLQLQLQWRKKYQHRDEIKKIHHERVFTNVLPLMTEISEENFTKTVDKDRLCKKIVIFIIMFAGLGSPTQQSILNETKAALRSIFKTTEVESFLSLSKTTKKQQLVEFARLITGIMLFSKDCKKGGEGMDDLPLILTQGVQATRERLINFKDELELKINELVHGLQQKYLKSLQFLELNEATVSESSMIRGGNIDENISLLIYFRHIECCLNDLMKDLEKSFVIVQDLVHRLQATLLQIHSVVRYRVAVATVQVFPLFLQLSNVWVEMQEEVDILSQINNNFVDLFMTPEPLRNVSLTEILMKLMFSLNLDLTLSQPLKRSLSNENIPASETVKIRDCLDFCPGVKVCSISSFSSLDHFQYKGFCAWTLSCGEGLLVNGNITIGVMQFSDRLYTFSSAEAAHNWALNPNHHIQTVLQIAKAKPELIKFLGLENDLLEKLPVEEDKKPTTTDSEVQTDLHPLEFLINKEYTFSEWELKKRVMKLATLTRCATKSQQTATHSCFRAETAAQATPCKNISTQTARNGFCNYPSSPKSFGASGRNSIGFCDLKLHAIKSLKN